ncbi:hypothetical protein GCM10011367_17200 [Marinicauda pacifica]|jgi:DUF971 family protein|uniref:DUF971 domain-containing protein n=1 Tax=Marinicauda pacifica TaxID=1133559 RepID=A0A4S2HB60_9PROT|nr:gamma-butyrobetaine hydroxylase-like domain-containing protein [Marinicauda pacifica]TGY93126.1 DUF971 domain-containing protein [Marinicauda pacifica]GGE43089.1 hypothetical protein GCM10011367_17200 [Marinicauda pacifica]
MAERAWPIQLIFKSAERELRVTFEGGEERRIPFELLRVESPSAEVQGHGPGQKKWLTGKDAVEVTAADPVGRYAVRLTFSDGHDSGIFSWDYLYELGEDPEARLTEHHDAAANATGRSR